MKKFINLITFKFEVNILLNIEVDTGDLKHRFVRYDFDSDDFSWRQEADCVTKCSYIYYESDPDIPWFSLVQLNTEKTTGFVSMFGNGGNYIISFDMSDGSILSKFSLSGMGDDIYIPFSNKIITSELLSLVYMNEDGVGLLILNLNTLETYEYFQVMEHSIIFAISPVADGNKKVYLGGYNTDDHAQAIAADYDYLETIGEIFTLNQDLVTIENITNSDVMSVSAYTSTTYTLSTHDQELASGVYIEGVDLTTTISDDLNFTYYQRVNIYESTLKFKSTEITGSSGPITYTCYADVVRLL